ncbi:putative mitochondrial hypothetical protein [Leptomonas pyrrhocoris]|uniref:Uncharacterized protein n=1 Tax=Leptomonas pyrrhocoris TaxID=157538 RepID=A0A0N0DYD7_LEPPY|nr:putative mitochondrial hypothetical protein [Leptomonas pyrrhocoris]KPA83971.1 putative mitochondrial hypothetical protein [Leptomonas pyrrhocoris]|eukprot:XP_015662410.1 putative mitochondrial hypothetical protein [Leptomonas pyrrhocoris]
MQRNQGWCAYRLARLCGTRPMLVWGSACVTKRRTFSSPPHPLSTALTARALTKGPSRPQQQSQCGRYTAMTCSWRAASSSSLRSGQNSSDGHRDQQASVDSPSLSSELTNVNAPFSPPFTAVDASLQRLEKVQAAESSSSSSSSSRAPRKSTRMSADAIGKSKHGPRTAKALKVKPKAPWGVQQLRDSWSEDAMSKRDRDNMDERIHREYRYHPDEVRRHYIRYTAFLTVPCILLGMSCTYYYETGRPIWTADPQHLLNLLRFLDTSPRSKLYAYKTEESEVLPPHVLAYRKAHEGERVYAEKVFRLTHSAFERPSEDVLRRLELEEKLKQMETTAVVDAGTLIDGSEDAALDDV